MSHYSPNTHYGIANARSSFLKLFAVIKELSPTLARPIENGHRVTKKTLGIPNARNLSLPGTNQVVTFLNAYNSSGKAAINLDLANYYFQLKNPHPQLHGFRCGKEVFLWDVLTMGWDDATSIAQAFTLDIVCRGNPSLEQTLVQPHSDGPPAIAQSNDLTCAVMCVYDSVLILDATSTTRRWKHQLDYNLRTAHAQAKFLNFISPNELFEGCGFQFLLDQTGLSWRITPSTLDTWESVAKSTPQSTARSLWRVLGFANFAFHAWSSPNPSVAPWPHHRW